jgi:hypothetical protein
LAKEFGITLERFDIESAEGLAEFLLRRGQTGRVPFILFMGTETRDFQSVEELEYFLQNN